MLHWPEYIKIFTGLISILNPIGAIPIFIGLSRGLPTKARLRIVRVSAFSVFVLLIVILFLGEPILEFFGISISSFRAAGGILILLMAISMMHGKPLQTKHTEEEEREAAFKDSIAVVPLATPLLAGPGSISTVILYSNRSHAWTHKLMLALVIAAVALVVFAALKSAPKLAQILGRTGINIVTRIMGLLMAAIGVEFIADSMLVLFPGLK